ncbi:MAG: DUF4136 domain-containing protein [Brevundimonas sp.]|nr:DUF4136 domain-containing protein [Brevundimonas sp.]
MPFGCGFSILPAERDPENYLELIDSICPSRYGDIDMMKLSRFAFVFIAMIVASGCASSSVSSRVSIFQQLPPEASSGIFAVVPWRPEVAGGLEFASYSDLISEKLSSNGFNVSGDLGEADYVVIVDYGIDDGQIVTRNYSVPQFGVTGYSGSTSTASVTSFGGVSTAQVRTNNSPIYGVTGYNQVSQVGREYSRYFSVDVVRINSDGTLGSKVYEGRLRSEGSCGSLQALMPIFVSALLDNFPSQTGTRTVSTPLTADC